MEIAQFGDNYDSAETRNTMLLFGGIALMMLGTGLVLTTPAVRRYLGGLNVAGLLQHAAPDFERYLKLKSM